MPARQALVRALESTSLQALVSPTGQIVLVAKPAKPPRSTRLDGTIRDAETVQTLDGARVELIGTRFTTYSRDSAASRSARSERRVHAARRWMGYEPLVTTILRAARDTQQRRSSSRCDARPSHSRRSSSRQATSACSRAVSPRPSRSHASSSRRSRRSARTSTAPSRVCRRVGRRLLGEVQCAWRLWRRAVCLARRARARRALSPQGPRRRFSIIDIQALGNAPSPGWLLRRVRRSPHRRIHAHDADPRTDGVHTSVGVSVMNARATSQGGFADGKGGCSYRRDRLPGPRAQAHGHP